MNSALELANREKDAFKVTSRKTVAISGDGVVSGRRQSGIFQIPNGEYVHQIHLKKKNIFRPHELAFKSSKIRRRESQILFVETISENKVYERRYS